MHRNWAAARTAGLQWATNLVSEHTSVSQTEAPEYVPDSKRACIYDCEQARSGTRKLRKDEKDEANHDCDSRVEAVSWSAEGTANQHAQHEAAPTTMPGSSFI